MAAHEWFLLAKEAIATGDPAWGRALLLEVVKEEPRSIEAMLMLADLAPDLAEAMHYICAALQIDPANQDAYQVMARVEARFPEAPGQPCAQEGVAPRPTNSPRSILFLVTLLIGFVSTIDIYSDLLVGRPVDRIIELAAVVGLLLGVGYFGILRLAAYQKNFYQFQLHYGWWLAAGAICLAALASVQANPQFDLTEVLLFLL